MAYGILNIDCRGGYYPPAEMTMEYHTNYAKIYKFTITENRYERITEKEATTYTRI